VIGLPRVDIFQPTTAATRVAAPGRLRARRRSSGPSLGFRLFRRGLDPSA
jgi:hypothetical protein